MKSLTAAFLFALTPLCLHAAVDPVPADATTVDPKPALDWRRAILDSKAQLDSRHFAEAAETAKRAVQVAKHVTSPDEHLAVSYFHLANIYREWGHCAEGRVNYMRSMAAWDKVSEAKPKYRFNTIVNLLSLLGECDEFPAAEKVLRANGAKLERYQSDPLDEVQVFSIRAVLAKARKNYTEAETDYRHAIQVLEKNTSSTPIQIEEARENLATVIDKQGRHAEALAISEHAIAFFEHNEGFRPNVLAGALNNAACSLADLGRYDESVRMFERALFVATDALGEDHRFTARIMLNYSGVLRQNKQTPAAEAMKKKGVDAFRRAIARDSAMVGVEDLRLDRGR